VKLDRAAVAACVGALVDYGELTRADSHGVFVTHDTHGGVALWWRGGLAASTPLDGRDADELARVLCDEAEGA
jgi:hypothetical protein